MGHKGQTGGWHMLGCRMGDPEKIHKGGTGRGRHCALDLRPECGSGTYFADTPTLGAGGWFSGINKIPSCPTEFAIHRGGHVLCKQFKGSLIRGRGGFEGGWKVIEDKGHHLTSKDWGHPRLLWLLDGVRNQTCQGSSRFLFLVQVLNSGSPAVHRDVKGSTSQSQEK